MTHGQTMRAHAQWAELDDLVAEEYSALDQGPLERAAPEPAPEPAIEAKAEDPMPPQPEEPPTVEDDESRFLALCRILGLADDPCRLVERLSASLPPPVVFTDFPLPAVVREPPDAG